MLTGGIWGFFVCFSLCFSVCFSVFLCFFSVCVLLNVSNASNLFFFLFLYPCSLLPSMMGALCSILLLSPWFFIISSVFSHIVGPSASIKSWFVVELRSKIFDVISTNIGPIWSGHVPFYSWRLLVNNSSSFFPKLRLRDCTHVSTFWRQSLLQNIPQNINKIWKTMHEKILVYCQIPTKVCWGWKITK